MVTLAFELLVFELLVVGYDFTGIAAAGCGIEHRRSMASSPLKGMSYGCENEISFINFEQNHDY